MTHGVGECGSIWGLILSSPSGCGSGFGHRAHVRVTGQPAGLGSVLRPRSPGMGLWPPGLATSAANRWAGRSVLISVPQTGLQLVLLPPPPPLPGMLSPRRPAQRPPPSASPSVRGFVSTLPPSTGCWWPQARWVPAAQGQPGGGGAGPTASECSPTRLETRVPAS